MMDEATRKYTAAHLALMVKDAQGPAPVGASGVDASPTLVDRMSASPLTSMLATGGLGAALGAAGGGLKSWLSDEDEKKRNRDVLAGALIGGGLGTGLGALPGLMSMTQEAARPIERAQILQDKPQTFGEALRNTFSNMTSAGGIGGGLLGASGAAAGGISLTRGRALSDLANLKKRQAALILEQFALPKIPPKNAASFINRMVANTTARRTAKNMARMLLARDPRAAWWALKDYTTATRLAGRSAKSPLLRLATLATLVGAGGLAGSTLGGAAQDEIGARVRALSGE